MMARPLASKRVAALILVPIGFLLAFTLSTANPIAIGHVSIQLSVLVILLSGQLFGFGSGFLVTLGAALAVTGGDNAAVPMLTTVGFYITTYYLRQKGALLAQGAAIFFTITFLIIALFSPEAAPGNMQALAFVYIRSAIGSIFLAAIADLLLRGITPTTQWPVANLRQSLSINQLSRSATSLAFCSLILFVVNLASQTLDDINRDHPARLRDRVAITLYENPRASLPLRMAIPGDGGDRIDVIVAPPSADAFALANTVWHGRCRPGPGVALLAADLGAELQDLLRSCGAFSVTINGKRLDGIADFGTIIEATVRKIMWQMAALFGMICLVSAYLLSVKNQILREFLATESLIFKFGRPRLELPADVHITEFQDMAQTIIQRNNVFLSNEAEREKLSGAVGELQRTIEFSMMADIRYDHDASRLCYTQLLLDGRSIAREMAVHPFDLNLFAQIDGSSDALVEFREPPPSEASHMLTLRGAAGPQSWSSGVMVAMRQPRRMREFLLHNARLMDLGGRASAICHELKQPLFTMALSAQSINLLLAQDGPVAMARLQERSMRIGEQVTRAQQIIDRIANYGRISMASDVTSDPSEAFETAVSFLATLLHENGIRCDVRQRSSGRVMIAPVALEQVMVNAIQNSIDAILEARASQNRPDAHRIEFEALCEDGQVTFSVLDDGIGVDTAGASSAFEPFYTSKSETGGSGLGLFIVRQIIMEASGQIALLPRAPHGTILQVHLPEAVACTEDRVTKA